MDRPLYRDMYKNFLSNVRKSRVGTVKPEDFALVLNLAINEVVTNKLSGMELNKKVTDDLVPLSKSVSLIDTTPDVRLKYSECTVEITNGYRRIRSVAVDLSATYSGVKCVKISSYEESDILNGYYSRPSVFQCYYEPDLSDNKQQLKIFIPKSFPIAATPQNYVKVNVKYYGNPTVVTASDVVSNAAQTQFGVEMATEVVNIASRMYIERVQDPRFQSFSHELNNKITN